MRCLGCMEPRDGGPVCRLCGWNHQAQSGSVLHLPPGAVLRDTYLVGRPLGQGGFGITYIGWDAHLQRKIAIKEYFPQMLASRERGTHTVVPSTASTKDDFQYGLQTFVNEGRTLARFSDHPCIVSVFNLMEANQTAYLIMGYLEGETLAQSLARMGGRLPYDSAYQICMRVMDGLREVHGQGLLHRDISPDNIYITRQGPVKILDFGAARQAVGERSQSLSVVLKEGYAPEEQYRRSGKQGPWTDVYAMAATLYRSITGVTPPASIERFHEDTLVRPAALGIRIPARAEDALMRAMAIRAADRLQSIESFQQALAGNGSVAAAAPANPVSTPAAPPVSKPAQRAPGKRLLYIGMAIFALSFLLPAVAREHEIFMGYSCALRAIQFRSWVMLSGVTNPLILLYLALRLTDRARKTRRLSAFGVLGCIGVAWYVIAELELTVLLGHVLWILGMFLILGRDLAFWKWQRRDGSRTIRSDAANSF